MNDVYLNGLLPHGVRRPPGFSSGGYAFVTWAWLNGRSAVDWEVPVIAYARKCERARDLEQLAGILTEAGPGLPQGVPLARQAPELQARRRTTIDLAPLS